MNLKSRLNKLEDTASRGVPEVTSYRAMLQRAIGIFNENMRRRHNYDGMSQRMRAKFDAELDDRRKRLWDATKAVAPGPVTFATMLDRAKAIQAEFKKQCNNEETR